MRLNILWRQWHSPLISLMAAFIVLSALAHTQKVSVADPDPSVSGPPGSGSVSRRYGSWSFYHQAKIVRKTLISTVLWYLYDFYLWKWCRKLKRKKNLLPPRRSLTKITGSGVGSGSVSHRYGSVEPYPQQCSPGSSTKASGKSAS